MKEVIYIGIGGLIVYLYMKNKQENNVRPISPKGSAAEIARKAVENSNFSIPDLSDRKLYNEDLKQCK